MNGIWIVNGYNRSIMLYQHTCEHMVQENNCIHFLSIKFRPNHYHQIITQDNFTCNYLCANSFCTLFIHRVNRWLCKLEQQQAKKRLNESTQSFIRIQFWCVSAVLFDHLISSISIITIMTAIVSSHYNSRQTSSIYICVLSNIFHQTNV